MHTALTALALSLAGCAFMPPHVPMHEEPAPPKTGDGEQLPKASRIPADDEDRILITIHEEDFVFEIADGDDERAKGLSQRESIAKHGGMIFVYQSAEPRRFWMMDCLVPIDIAFINAEGRIVAVHEMPVDPPIRAGEDELDYEFRLKRYPSNRPAQFALEFRAGTLDRLKLKVGEHIEFPREVLAARAKRNAETFDW